MTLYSRSVPNVRNPLPALCRAVAVCALATLILAMTLAPAHAQSIPDRLLEVSLGRAEWPPVRDGAALLRLPQVQALMRLFREDLPQRITIRYPGGDLGNAWAFELRDWLTAFGIPSRFVTLEPGSGSPDSLLILLDQES